MTVRISFLVLVAGGATRHFGKGIVTTLYTATSVEATAIVTFMTCMGRRFTGVLGPRVIGRLGVQNVRIAPALYSSHNCSPLRRAPYL